MTKTKVSEVTLVVEKLMDLLGVSAKISVEEEKTKEGTPIFKVVIDADPDAGLLIGAHGANLTALQSFLAQAVKTRFGEWYPVNLDISGWKAKQDDELIVVARQAADRARSTGEAQHLYNLTPAQRRVVHTALGEEVGVETFSEGEGHERYLVVRAK